jgi:hypothetical protein
MCSIRSLQLPSTASSDILTASVNEAQTNGATTLNTNHPLLWLSDFTFSVKQLHGLWQGILQILQVRISNISVLPLLSFILCRLRNTQQNIGI